MVLFFNHPMAVHVTVFWCLRQTVIVKFIRYYYLRINRYVFGLNRYQTPSHYLASNWWTGLRTLLSGYLIKKVQELSAGKVRTWERQSRLGMKKRDYGRLVEMPVKGSPRGKRAAASPSPG